MNARPPHPVQTAMRHLTLPLLAALALACATPAAAAMIDELSPADQAKLQAGQSIVTTIDKPGATWPEVRIYRKVKATPQGVTDLFLDYENASSFIDNLESAVVENQPDAQTKDVRYNVRLPVLLSISYLVRNRYQKTSNGYTIHWNLLESVFAKSADGSLRVEPHSDGSIICYTNHVEPATKLVAGLRGQAIKQANTTVDSIAKEAERRHRSQKR
jgi:hypothetical protein